jgi:hypothetical protein
MLDWWTVRGERWGVRSLDFKVELKEEGSVTPQQLQDYSEADLTAFDGGDWHFVTVRVVPVDRDLTDLVGAEKFMRGVDWGELASGRIDRDDLTSAQVRDLALEAVRSLREVGMHVDTERDCEFAIGRTTAPF